MFILRNNYSNSNYTTIIKLYSINYNINVGGRRAKRYLCPLYGRRLPRTPQITLRVPESTGPPWVQCDGRRPSDTYDTFLCTTSDVSDFDYCSRNAHEITPGLGFGTENLFALRKWHTVPITDNRSRRAGERNVKPCSACYTHACISYVKGSSTDCGYRNNMKYNVCHRDTTKCEKPSNTRERTIESQVVVSRKTIRDFAGLRCRRPRVFRGENCAKRNNARTVFFALDFENEFGQYDRNTTLSHLLGTLISLLYE